ncbi:MAG: hypothetical protein V5804_17320, partial [Mucilaginibacter sp.]|uniref:hypothetical protein n=1 Tax=Mucilaginibacter sp. TaxID=1882438 RepID=UPI0034E58C78
MEISLQQEINKVRVVNSERRYWFLRTYSGELYNYFLENNFVGLGFNNVPYQYIEEAQISDEATLNRLQKYIDSNSEYKKGEATKWAKQLVTFNHLVKVDDIVIIPSKSSDDLSFGIIESDTFFVKTEKTFLFNERYEPYPEKRKKVKWIKTITKLELRGELKNMFTSRGALSSADTYSEVIEGNLSTVYIKNDVGYLTIKVDEDEEINAFALQEFLSSL